MYLDAEDNQSWLGDYIVKSLNHTARSKKSHLYYY